MTGPIGPGGGAVPALRPTPGTAAAGASLRPLTAPPLRRGSDRPDPGLDPGLAPEPTEQAWLWFAEDHELGVVLGDAQQVQHGLLGFGE